MRISQLLCSRTGLLCTGSCVCPRSNVLCTHRCDLHAGPRDLLPTAGLQASSLPAEATVPLPQTRLCARLCSGTVLCSRTCGSSLLWHRLQPPLCSTIRLRSHGSDGTLVLGPSRRHTVNAKRSATPRGRPLFLVDQSWRGPRPAGADDASSRRGAEARKFC